MAIARSTATRLEEAVYKIVSQDPDLFDRWEGVVGSGSYAAPDTKPRCFIGPMFVDPQQVTAPQGHVTAMLSPPLEDGVGGANLVTHTIRVMLIEDFAEPTRTAGGNRILDYGVHVIGLVKAAGDNMGRLTDPDDAGEKLNDRIARVEVTAEQDFEGRYIALGIDFIFETYEDTQGDLLS